MKDTLQRFLFENLDVRGEIVHLDATWKTVLEHHDYPLPVQKILGELMAAVSLLIATLKFEGKLIAQIQGDGPVNLLVVEGTSDNTLRATVNMTDKQQDLAESTLQEIFGDARFVITLEPNKGERYQGIVALSGENLADTLTDYLLRSEQLDTNIWLAADEKSSAGLLIQKLPKTNKTQQSSNILNVTEQSEDIDGWNRVQQLSSTIKNEELLELGAEEIIYRLYHEEDIRLFDAEKISFFCHCSRERVAKMLVSLGTEEVKSMIEELTTIEVACEFCNHNYIFDAVDAEQLFASDIAHQTPKTEH